MKTIKYDEKGIIFVVLLMILFSLSMMSICYLLISRTELSKSYMQERIITTLATAEAGFERAIWYLVNDDTRRNIPTPCNPKVTIKEYLGGTETGKYYEAEIHLISVPRGNVNKLPPRENVGWYIHPREANIPFPKRSAAAVTINGRIYVFGGSGQSTKSTEHGGRKKLKDDINYWGYCRKGSGSNLLLCYDPSTNCWKNLGECPYGNRTGHAAVNFNNKMYIFGGSVEENKSNSVIVYDPQNDEWNKVADMKSILGIKQINYHSAVVMNDKIYIIGGEYKTTFSKKKGLVIEFDPANNTFRELNPLPDGRSYGAAGVIKNKIYYVGGVVNAKFKEGLIDPVTGEKITPKKGCHTRTVWEYDPMADEGNGTATFAPHIPWLRDDPNTFCPEHLAARGEGDIIEGFDEKLEGIRMKVRDPEYRDSFSYEGYGASFLTSFSNRPGLADCQAIVVDDKLYVIGGNTAHLRSYFDGPGYRDNKKKWHGTYIPEDNDPDNLITSNTTGETITIRDLFYDYKDGVSYGDYLSYRDWQGQVGSYYRWSKELYVFDGNSWERLEDAPTMKMMTTGGMQGVGIAKHTLAEADGRFFIIGGIGHHFRNPNKQYLNEYVVEGDDTSHGNASASYVNCMYTSVAEYFIGSSEVQSVQPERYKIISTGREKLFHKTVHRKVEAVVEVVPMTGANEFDGAIICNSSISISGNVRTDSYNSAKNKYTPGINDGNEGNIFSNGVISVGGSAVIDGNIHCGVKENIGIIGNAKVTGSKRSLGEKILLPDITVPEEAIDLGPIELTGNEERILIQNTYTCSSLTIKGSASLVIDGNVNIYCTGDIEIADQGSVNNNNTRGNTTNFHIYCPDNVNIKLTGNNSFFGTIYAPKSKITIGGNGDIYGQIVANEIDLSGSVGVIYDEQLKNTIWWPVEGRSAKTVYWREVIL